MQIRTRVRRAAAVVVVLALPGTAAGLGQKGPQGYYLALGDSIAYGFDPGKGGSAVAVRHRVRRPLRRASAEAVTEDRSRQLRVSRRIERDVREGRLPLPSRGREAARSVSRCTAQGGVGVPESSPGTGQPDNPDAVGQRPGAVVGQGQEGSPKAIASFASRLDSILKQLRAAAPNAEIIVTGAWNPEVDQVKKTQPLYRSLDAAIARTSAASRARVAKMFAVFNPPANVRRVCALSYICAKGDPHPNAAGYRAMANAFFAASGYARKP